MQWDPEIESQRALHDLLGRVSYKPGWYFRLGSTRLEIGLETTDSLSGRTLEVRHMRPLPPIPMSELTLRRWLFEQIILVEQHEAMEFFKVDGEAPYFPDHTPGGDPYALVDRDASREAGPYAPGPSELRLPGERSVFDRIPPG